MKTVHQHFETIAITAFIAKQEIIVRCKDNNTYRGFVQRDMTEKGFSLDEQLIHWVDIVEIQLTDQYFHFWEDILHLKKPTS